MSPAIFLAVGLTGSMNPIDAHADTYNFSVPPVQLHFTDIIPLPKNVTYADSRLYSAFDMHSYIENLKQSFESFESEGYVEIPLSISTADEFYEWLHREQ